MLFRGVQTIILLAEAGATAGTALTAGFSAATGRTLEVRLERTTAAEAELFMIAAIFDGLGL